MIARKRRFLGVISVFLFCLVPYLHSQNEKSKPPIFKVKVDTVFLKVTVFDTLNRYVSGLEMNNFRIYEDKIQQTVSHFSKQSAPISLGIIFDVSGSMKNSLGSGKGWFSRLMKSGNWHPEDEYFLITFNHIVRLDEDFTSDRSELEYDMALKKSGGWTALYDAIYKGLDTVKEGRNDKKAIILITDGGENRSRYKLSEIRELAVESDAQIYALLLGGHNAIEPVIALTGGRAFFPEAGLDYYLSLIHSELRSQYVLGYSPTNRMRNGSWRRIRVELDMPKDFPALRVRTKTGYFAPKD